MRNIFLVVEYAGTNYAGWQAQPELPTIQSELEKALLRLTGEQARVTGSGRTDAGVHAAGQAANFRTTSALPLKAFVRGANALLPGDISVRSAREVPAGFDARRSARFKTYRYSIHNSPVRSGLAAPYSWWVPYQLDAAVMDRAARLFIGTHDFGAFRSAGCDARHSFRTVDAASVTKDGVALSFEVTGNGFLRNMVRIMAGTLVGVGGGRMTLAQVSRALASGGREDSGPTAPPWGLCLMRVVYDLEESESYP